MPSAKASKGLPLPDGRETLGGYLDYWLEARVRPRSFNSYEGPIRLYIKPRLGKRRLVKLSVEDVQYWIASLGRDGLAPRTIRLALTILRMALRTAQATKKVEMNVA